MSEMKLIFLKKALHILFKGPTKRLQIIVLFVRQDLSVKKKL